jgi:hypothetical protein
LTPSGLLLEGVVATIQAGTARHAALPLAEVRH